MAAVDPYARNKYRFSYPEPDNRSVSGFNPRPEQPRGGPNAITDELTWLTYNGRHDVLFRCGNGSEHARGRKAPRSYCWVCLHMRWPDRKVALEWGFLNVEPRHARACAWCLR